MTKYDIESRSANFGDVWPKTRLGVVIERVGVKLKLIKPESAVKIERNEVTNIIKPDEGNDE